MRLELFTVLFVCASLSYARNRKHPAHKRVPKTGTNATHNHAKHAVYHKDVSMQQSNENSKHSKLQNNTSKVPRIVKTTIADERKAHHLTMKQLKQAGRVNTTNADDKKAHHLPKKPLEQPATRRQLDGRDVKCRNSRGERCDTDNGEGCRCYQATMECADGSKF